MPSFYGARISKEVPEGNLMCICHAIMMSKIFWLIGHFVLVFIPMKLGIVWLRRYFIFFLKR